MMRSRGLLAAAVLGMVAAGPAMIGQAAPVPRAIVGKKQRRGLFNGKAYASEMAFGTRKAGISMAQQKRNSKKRRNQARHKALAKK